MPVKTFFVATPYGNPHGTPDEQAMHDLIAGVRGNIMDAAVARCRAQGFDVAAAFGSDQAGGENIWDKIGNDIAAAFGVIGVVASDKPNTYLEIGLAYALWHTPILLHFVEHDLPTDLLGAEVGKFTREQALGTADADGVVDWLAQRLLSTPPRHNRTAPGYLPETASSAGRLLTYDRFSKAVNAEAWSDTLWEAEREIILAGPKLYKLFKQPWSARPEPDGRRAEAAVKIEDILVEKAVMDGVDVTVITPHPDWIGERDLKRPLTEDGLEDFRIDLERSRKLWRTVEQSIRSRAGADGNRPRRIGRIRVVRTRRCHFPHRLTMTEKRMLLTLRFYTEDVNTRFCIDAGPQFAADAYTAPIFDLIRSDVEVILAEEHDAPDDPGALAAEA